MWSVRRKASERVIEQRKKNLSHFTFSSDNEDVEKRRAILEKDFTTLRDALQRDEVSAEEVWRAYMWRALQVQEETNCLNEVIVESLEWAREADAVWKGKQSKPPLHGMPFSVKGNFYMKGYECNLGLGKFAEQKKDTECTFVTHLRSLGAIPFVITTVPQSLLSFVCSTPIYGTTGNPHDVSRTPGGSSGGEGALRASKGNSFGIGSDLLGSLRIPASMCGITTLKPTESRFVVRNSHGGMPGKNRLGLGYGFYTQTVDEQIQLLSLTLGSEEYAKLVPDSSRTSLNMEKVNGKGPLRIGYFTYDGFLPCVPSVVRAVEDTVGKLREAGHNLIPFTVPKVCLVARMTMREEELQPEEAVRLMSKETMPDGGKFNLFLFSNDVVDKHMKAFVNLLKVPSWIRSWVSPLIRPFSSQLAIMAADYMRDPSDVRYTNEQTDAYKSEMIAYWQSLNLDAVVCPTFAVSAVPHHLPSHLAACAFATGLWNLVDFPAACVPVGRVNKGDDEALEDDAVFPVYRNPVLKCMREGCAKSEGLPLSVQVGPAVREARERGLMQIVTLPLEEEMCLRVMREVEKTSTYDFTLKSEKKKTE